jgi:hypothetical protein
MTESRKGANDGDDCGNDRYDTNALAFASPGQAEAQA